MNSSARTGAAMTSSAQDEFLPRLKKYNKWAAQSVAAGKFKNHLQLFPIPLTELNQNLDMRIDGKFDQNERFR